MPTARPKKGGKSFGEYLDANPRMRRHPLEEFVPAELLEQLEKGYQEGYGFQVLSRWLQEEHGIEEATGSRINRYLERKKIRRPTEK